MITLSTGAVVELQVCNGELAKINSVHILAHKPCGGSVCNFYASRVSSMNTWRKEEV